MSWVWQMVSKSKRDQLWTQRITQNFFHWYLLRFGIKSKGVTLNNPSRNLHFDTASCTPRNLRIQKSYEVDP